MAFVRYHYDVISLKKRPFLNRKAINMHYKLDHVKWSNISVLQELLRCRDSTNATEFLSNEEVNNSLIELICNARKPIL